MFGVALSFGDLTATLQTQGDYNSMVMEDMCNQARASIIELLAALPGADDASDLELDEATVAAIAALLNNNDA